MEDIDCTDTKSTNIYFIDSTCIYVQFLSGTIKNCKYFNTEWLTQCKFDNIEEAELNNVYDYCKLCKSKLCMKYDNLKKDYYNTECPVIINIVKTNMSNNQNGINEIDKTLKILFSEEVPILFHYFENNCDVEDCKVCISKPCVSLDAEVVKYYHNAIHTDFRLLEESQDIVNYINTRIDRYGVCNAISILDYAFTNTFNLKFETEDDKKKFYIKVIHTIIWDCIKNDHA